MSLWDWLLAAWIYEEVFDNDSDTPSHDNTCQVAKYDNYELGSFSEEAKHAWRDAHWEEDLQRAYDAGRKMAE